MKVTQRQRLAVITRDESRCARCRKGVGNIPSSVHHRKPRGMGGTSDPRCNDYRNLVLLCGTGTTGCHGWVEYHRADAYDEGWLLRSYDELNYPAMRTDGAWLTLTRDGRSFTSPLRMLPAPEAGEPA